MIKCSTAVTYHFKGTCESRWDTFSCSLCIPMSECNAGEGMTFESARRRHGWYIITSLNDKLRTIHLHRNIQPKVEENTQRIHERFLSGLQQGFFLSAYTNKNASIVIQNEILQLNSSNSKESLTLNIGSYELQQSSILIPSGSIGENTLIVSADLYICLQDFSLEPDLIQQTFQLSSAITQDCVLIWLKFSPGCNNLLERIGFMRFLLLHTSAVSLLMVLFLTTREPPATRKAVLSSINNCMTLFLWGTSYGHFQ